MAFQEIIKLSKVLHTNLKDTYYIFWWFCISLTSECFAKFNKQFNYGRFSTKHFSTIFFFIFNLNRCLKINSFKFKSCLELWLFINGSLKFHDYLKLFQIETNQKTFVQDSAKVDCGWGKIYIYNNKLM